MPYHAERRILPYSQRQMFELVADVGRYPEFLPWCVGARINRREGNVFWADLVIGFRLIRERFASRVTLRPCREIEVEYVRGPLRYLKNRWVFEKLDGPGTEIDFYVDFEFRSAILERMIGALFHEAVRRMVSAFEQRAAAVYGAPGEGAAPGAAPPPPD